MSKQKTRKLNHRLAAGLSVALLVVAGVTQGFGVFAASCSTTSDCQQQINALAQQKADAQAASNKLAIQATSYQDAINKLDTKINTLQEAIVANQNKSDELKKEIAKAQTQLNHEKKTLGENIRQMYLQGDMSTLEVLASSNNLSTYVNRQEYRDAVQQQVKDTLDKITKLKLELQQRQESLDGAIKAQQAQRAELSSAQSEQASLLSYTEGQKAAYDSQIASSQKQINQLNQRIIALNTPVGSSVSYGGACGGGYPGSASGPYGNWGCNYAQDNTIDNWGMYNRECVSYTAWKEAATGHYVPYGLGNAGDWIYNVPSSWVSQSPQAGDVAIRPADPSLVFFNGERDVGHAMYVESVNGNGTINISQYNASLNGTYSYVAGRSTSGLYFIHFPSN
ncbi:MAG TPA: CHAP domain-containing protein [Candidatus Saccharimonadales bacterium]|nr:CHAP domain-containing protein [Candidatus Saccharimonadales bacterium]